MSAISKRQLVVNIFGSFGYMSLVLQWLWVSVLFLPQVFENDGIKDFFMPAGDVSSVPSFQFHTPPLLATVLAVIITAVVLVATIIILIRIPATISKTGKKVTHTSAEKIIPVLTHRRKLPEKQKRLLTIRTIRLLKLIFILLPFLLLFLTALIPTGLPNNIVLLVGGFLGLSSLLWFGLEYSFAKILGIEPMKLI